MDTGQDNSFNVDGCTCSSGAAKVHEGPGVQLGETQDIPWLDISVNPAAMMQLLKLLGDVSQCLRTMIYVFICMQR